MRKTLYIVVVALAVLMLSSIGYAYAKGPVGSSSRECGVECQSGAQSASVDCPTPENCPVGGQKTGCPKAGEAGSVCGEGPCGSSVQDGRMMRGQNGSGCASGGSCEVN